MVEGSLKVFKMGLGRTFIVVERHQLVQQRKITGLFNVVNSRQNEPKRIVVKVATNGIVAALGQGLILVIGPAILKLCRSNVDDSLPGSFGNLMHKANQILVGITKTHSTTDAHFKKGG